MKGPLIAVLEQVVSHGLQSNSGITVELDDILSTEILVPLAAVLLEYPIAYVPNSGQKEFLAGVPLDVYTCRVQNYEHVDLGTLLKFSCPCATGEDIPALTPAALVESMRSKFQPRLDGLGLFVRVDHRVETLDRVAL